MSGTHMMQQRKHPFDQLSLHQAKQAAHKAYLAAKRVLDLLDETADEAWIKHAEASRDHAWKLYEALVLETEA